MHNFAAYDSKLLIQIINNDRKMRVHPDFLLSNSQKFRYITYNSYKFKDSIEHLPSSLSNLVKELNNPSQKHTFQIIKQSKIIKSFFPKNMEDEKLNKAYEMLCAGKGIFPYKLASNVKEMKKITEFPSIPFFFNDLKNEECSSSDYKFSRKVYKLFECKNLYEYCILYNTLDTILLSEIFLVYRNIIYTHFEIDVNHFLGIPGLAYKIMMKLSDTKIELISNRKMNKFFQHSIRGGCSFIKTRFAVSDYEKPNEDNENDLKHDNLLRNHVRYIDCNNLYGSCMLLDLPTKNFKFETSKKI